MFALAGFLLSACTAPAATPAPTAPSSAAAPFDPEAALAASAGGIDAGGYAFSVTGLDFEMSGAVHPPSGGADLLVVTNQRTVSVTTRERVIDGGSYRQWSVSGGDWENNEELLVLMERSPNAGVREDAAVGREMRKFLDGVLWTPPGTLPSPFTPQLNLNDPDVIGVKRLLGRVNTAQGDNLAITGTLDSSMLTKDKTVIGMLARSHPPRTGKAMPFRALLDAQNHIATLSLLTPGSPDTWVISLGEYGSGPVAAPPADSIKKPSARVLTFLRRNDFTEPPWNLRKPPTVE